MSLTDKVHSASRSIVREYRRLENNNPNHELLQPTYLLATEYIRQTADRHSEDKLFALQVQDQMTGQDEEAKAKVLKFIDKFSGGDSRLFDVAKVLTSYALELRTTSDKIEGIS